MNKKICAILLAISMIFSYGIQVFAWESAADNANDFAKELIKALNIMQIDEKAGFDEHKAVTRDELAEIIVNLANAAGAKFYTQYFTDVNNDNFQLKIHVMHYIFVHKEKAGHFLRLEIFDLLYQT